jgi:gluconate 2-dehydrogenase gamma chain
MSNRRDFLKSAAALGAAIPASAAAQHSGQAQHGTIKRPPPPAPARPYMFLSQAEVAFIDAAVSHLIPKDELGPGAKEAGVTYFIDQQLFGGFGTMAKMYRQGPHPEGTPQQGYQSPLTPQEVYRAAIREINATLGKPFDKFPPSEQDDILRKLDEGKLALESVPSRFFFNMLLDNTVEGFFSDPIYGGNRDKIGWKLVGFPGVHASYANDIERHNVPWTRPPASIADTRP